MAQQFGEEEPSFSLGVLLLGLTCPVMIGLEAGTPVRCLCWGAGAPVISEASAVCGGGEWMAAEYKVQERCAHRAVRG